LEEDIRRNIDLFEAVREITENSKTDKGKLQPVKAHQRVLIPT
jgi:hypothetical protein